MISPILKKLRYKPGARVCVIGAPSAFEAELAAAREVTRAEGLGKNLDLIQAFFTRKTHLEREMRRLQASTGDRAILWVCYPKAKNLGTDLNRDVVRKTVAQAGLKVVSLVAVDEVWSALRCKAVS